MALGLGLGPRLASRIQGELEVELQASSSRREQVFCQDLLASASAERPVLRRI
eukprot:CAMPEP_0203867990 /NCGR_PEP_ID=MMETSP0359-20131031/16850_1 /ASSEMBLY_ACC=CAM_ASM_000338 /TAXON_ID=268821 /ORGANISM="Scrippsiella Hangoei, Strain SHTV-5" /LENGTH=52 /DNA_ID=CAMNT_0050786331 /DNA_START=82 /DNA_END=240 /DNA_ORIENTATION=+